YAFSDRPILTRDPQFIGVVNIRQKLLDCLLLDRLEAVLFPVVLAEPVRFVAAVGLGLLLAAPRPGGRWFRTAVYMPTVIPDVALAVLFLWVLNPLYGPLNQLLGLCGHQGYNWLADPSTACIGGGLLLAFPIRQALVVVLAARPLSSLPAAW
ncbi:sugar ABC transporter permease, partial [Micromonospora fiedleri]|nr:sugar ABC transporter permease [Micromonospora fiedleri]